MTSSTSAGEPVLPFGKAARSLPEQVAERLLADIMAGKLPAGARLKEVELAQEHAVSRATVREALITLSRRGFVERLPRFGAKVTPFAQEDVFDLFEIRALLLGLAARKCAVMQEHVTPRLEELVTSMERLADEDEVDPQVFAEHSIQAQSLLVTTSGNRHLPDLYDHLASMSTWRLIRGRATSFLSGMRRKKAAVDWRKLVAAIRSGDAEAAEHCARQLLAHSAIGVRTQLGSEELARSQ